MLRTMIRRSVPLVPALAMALAMPASATTFDHLLMVKVKGSQNVSAKATLTTADTVTAALNGTGCVISGSPRLALIPVAKSLAPGSPLPSHNPPSVDLTSAATDQVYVCYKVRCNERNSLSMMKDDQFKTQNLIVSPSSRMLCAPAATTPVEPCGSTVYPSCGGACAAGQDCVATESTCECVPTPGCGKGGLQFPQCAAGNCPSNTLCAFGAGPGFCACHPTCETSSAPSCGGICPSGSSCSNVGGNACGCITTTGCGDRQAGQCAGAPCPAGQNCTSVAGSCACQ